MSPSGMQSPETTMCDCACNKFSMFSSQVLTCNMQCLILSISIFISLTSLLCRFTPNSVGSGYISFSNEKSGIIPRVGAVSGMSESELCDSVVGAVQEASECVAGLVCRGSDLVVIDV